MDNLIIESLKLNLIMSAKWTNDYAGIEDVNRNHTNYGAVTAYANTLSNFGVKVDVPVYEEGGVLKIPKILIDTRWIYFYN